MGTTFNDSGVAIDRTVHALKTIDAVHHEIHEGEHFEASNVQTAQTAFDWLVTTPVDKYVHMVTQLVSIGACTLTVYRAATATASANAVTPVNNNHNSSKTAGTAICHTPTSITTGSDIVDRQLLAAGNNQGAQSRNDLERILLPNTKYLFRFAAGTPTDVLIRWMFYEEPEL